MMRTSIHAVIGNAMSSNERRTNVISWLAIACGLVLGIAGESAVLAQGEAPKQLRQAAETLPRIDFPAANGAQAATTRAVDPFTTGAKPQWIWGADDNVVYLGKRSFTLNGPVKSAVLRVACDNHAVVSLNNKVVARNDSWAEFTEVDVKAILQTGANEFSIEMRNAGGPAGCLLKLHVVPMTGDAVDIVTDGAWMMSAAAPDQAVAARVIGPLGMDPWKDIFATGSDGGAKAPRNVFQTPPGFEVDRLFTVPKDQWGSWVAICNDDKGRLIVSDQEQKGLYRITPAPLAGGETVIDKLDVALTAAHGLLHAFDSLYVTVNGGPGSGVYRCRDTNGDDQYDEVKKLLPINGGGEHGPHSLRLSPDGKSLYLIAGNYTKLPDLKSSRVPKIWAEDHLLPRQWDANGHAAGLMAPGGWIARMDPDGTNVELATMGYRNPFDFDFNADGEMFAYDADMEWDVGSPWYRPTRVVHATSGSEFGWRSGTGKWPTHYIDSLPPAVDIGPGSPVGVTFGYGARFPAKYQQALFILDWTFGTIYAIHLTPDGSTYRGMKEEFVARTPLPLTDGVIGRDGSFYFLVGGRGTQSELFRVRYAGSESTAPVDAKQSQSADLRALRRSLEAHHLARTSGPESAAAIDAAIPRLGHADRFIRFAARTALEHQPVSTWQDAVLALKSVDGQLTGWTALARCGDKSLQPKLIAALEKLDLAKLTEPQLLDALRVWSLVFTRMGEPDDATRERIAPKFAAVFPHASTAANRELVNLLVYLKSPVVLEKTLPLMAASATQQPLSDSDRELLARNAGYGEAIRKSLTNRPDAQQMHYAFALRNVKTPWTMEQRKAYFSWFERARGWSGGASYPGFLRNIDREAFENATEAERLAMEALGARPAYKRPELPQPVGPGRDWTLAELLALSETKMTGRKFENGEKMFAAARCIICHRFAGDGGATGPDLTQSAGRFGFKDMAEAIIDPSKVVSDQYKATTILTKDGKTYNGKVIPAGESSVRMLIDPEDPTKMIELPLDQIEERAVATASLMPAGLLKALNEDEVLDLMAYILSRGNKGDAMFRK